jgi:hypothetical protein
MNVQACVEATYDALGPNKEFLYNVLLLQNTA